MKDAARRKKSGRKISVFKRVLRWIVFSLIAQIILLAFVEFVYLPNRNSFTAVSADMHNGILRSRGFTLPGDAGPVAVSCSGLHAACIDDGKLLIVDTGNGRVLKEIAPAKSAPSYYRWLPDREMVIFAEIAKAADGKTVSAHIGTCDAESGAVNYYPAIQKLPPHCVVTDIQVSALTNVVYVRIKKSEKLSLIYRFNIMDKLAYVTALNNTTRLLELQYSDVLLYTTAAGKTYARDGKTGSSSVMNIPVKSMLLGADMDDVIYTAHADGDGLIDTVFIAGLASLKKGILGETSLGGRYKPEDVYIAWDGGIYIIQPVPGFGSGFEVSGIKNGISFKTASKPVSIGERFYVVLEGKKVRIIVFAE